MIKSYSQFNESIAFPNTEEEVIRLCEEHKIKYYTINEDMSIDVRDSVYLNNKRLYKIPIIFRNISGDFYCNYNELINLEGCPNIVSGNFECNNNELLSLKCSPHEVGGYFDCRYNKLTSLEGLPKIIGRAIYCEHNNIKSFKGVPEYFEGFLFCEGNPIYQIYKLFNTDSKRIFWINEYDVIKGDNIVMDRLEEVFIQLGMEVPIIEEIEGYNLI